MTEQDPEADPLARTPTGKPRARSLGIPFSGTPGPWNAITDVPGVEVGYVTLIEGDHIRTGVTAIHPRGRRRPGDPVAAGFHSQNGNGEMTGVAWIEESGTFSGPIAITNTHAVGVAHAGIVTWTARHHPELTRAWLLPVAAETWDGYLNDINGHHDLFLAFSTANDGAFTREDYGRLSFLPWGHIDPFYEAVVEAVEEAVANSLVANEDMTGRDGHRTPALPRDMVAALIARAGSG